MTYKTSAMLLLLLGTAAAGPQAVRWKTDLDGALAEAKNTRLALNTSAKLSSE